MKTALKIILALIDLWFMVYCVIHFFHNVKIGNIEMAILFVAAFSVFITDFSESVKKLANQLKESQSGGTYI
jgi:uncharacterized membrane protein